jgi:Transposase
MTYSLDFRRKVLSVREADGPTMAEVAVRFDVGVASVVRWIKRPEPHMTRIKPAIRIDMIALAADVRLFPDAYQDERAARLGVSKSGIGSALQRMGYSFKKNSTSSKSRRKGKTSVSGAD